MSSKREEFKPIEGFEDKETYIVLVDGDIFYGRYRIQTYETVDFIYSDFALLKGMGYSINMTRTLIFRHQDIVKLDKIYIHNPQELDDWVSNHPEYII
ncbi:hypothetical protein [Vibrio phage phiKT1024]|nr:hypothetical protein [Vibrio phage phiKT1024]